jgi:hypothetical protein
MNVGLTKKGEDDTLVFYEAYLDDIYEKHDEAYVCVTKYATIKYNKKNNHTEYIWEKTDPYYKEHKSRALHMLSLILGKMKRCKKEGNFPENTGISTG